MSISMLNVKDSYHNSSSESSSSSSIISRSGKFPTVTRFPRINPPYFGPGAVKYRFPSFNVVPSVLPTGSSKMTPTQCPPPPSSGIIPTKAIEPRRFPGEISQRILTCTPSTVSIPYSFSISVLDAPLVPPEGSTSVFSSSSLRTTVPASSNSKPRGSSNPNFACLCASINSRCSFACLARLKSGSFFFISLPQSLNVPLRLLYCSSDMTYRSTSEVSSYPPPRDAELGSISTQCTVIP
mmetsp:Transcript_33504/g.40145  ORF Transcript_33504/g.40145 Transcript_33504/m.40145 type:complete len:239 (+) Transcript_33504:130-846(+)